MRRSRGGGEQAVQTSSQKSQNLGILSKTSLDLLKNRKATKPEFNVGPSSASQRWRVDDGRLIYWFIHPIINYEKTKQKVTSKFDPL